jgi:hypothetical protein
MELGERQRAFTLMVAQLIIFAYARGYELTFGEAYRTDAQQELHLKSGKSRVKRSKHQDRLAVDFNLFVNGVFAKDAGAYRMLGEKWESLGGRWGGRFGVKPESYATEVGWDANHFEYNG